MQSMYYSVNKGRLLARPRRGFTLIEMMITVAVMAILLSIAAPSFNSVLLGSKLGAYANNFVASALSARSEAIKRNAVLTLCASADGATCATSGGWEQGWIVMAGTTIIQRQPAVDSGFKITGLDASSSVIRTLAFQPTGVGATRATLAVCRATPSPGSQERVISINATGRTSVSKTTTGICS